MAGSVEHDRAGHLDLGHRALPPVPGLLVGLAERQREPANQRWKNTSMVPGCSTSQILWSRPGLRRKRAVGQFGEAEPGLAALLIGPLMAVDPDLHRPWAVGADLDERRPEMPTSAFRPICRAPGYAAPVAGLLLGGWFLPGVIGIISKLLRIVTSRILIVTIASLVVIGEAIMGGSQRGGHPSRIQVSGPLAPYAEGSGAGSWPRVGLHGIRCWRMRSWWRI